MITVRFSDDGPRYHLPGYDDEEEYARQIQSAMTGLSIAKLVKADITASELELLEAAKVPKSPKLEVVK